MKIQLKIGENLNKKHGRRAGLSGEKAQIYIIILILNFKNAGMFDIDFFQFLFFMTTFHFGLLIIVVFSFFFIFVGKL